MDRCNRSLNLRGGLRFPRGRAFGRPGSVPKDVVAGIHFSSENDIVLGGQLQATPLRGGAIGSDLRVMSGIRSKP
jgi:hypothetical protein